MDILTDLTARRAALTPDRVAFHDVLSGERLDYRQLEPPVSWPMRALSPVTA